MATKEQDLILSHLKQYLGEGWSEKARRKNADFAAAVEALSANELTFGAQPTFVYGYVEGSSTASGEKEYGNTKSQRTISMEFSTNTCLFIDPDENRASKETCKAAPKYLKNIPAEIHSTAESESMANRYGKDLCRQSLWDLDYSMKEYRLNRFHFRAASDPFKAPIWPIYGATLLKGKVKDTLLGYWIKEGGKDYIDIDIHIPMTKTKKFLIFGVIAILAVAAAFIIANL
ncbi:MAG: hypothetical protein IJY12_05640 [Clostridia bacterium]|nr:hypothetical protein [Clostridia bacterium]